MPSELFGEKPHSVPDYNLHMQRGMRTVSLRVGGLGPHALMPHQVSDTEEMYDSFVFLLLPDLRNMSPPSPLSISGDQGM
jgi:hypothetical protein